MVVVLQLVGRMNLPVGEDVLKLRDGRCIGDPVNARSAFAEAAAIAVRHITDTKNPLARRAFRPPCTAPPNPTARSGDRAGAPQAKSPPAAHHRGRYQIPLASRQTDRR